METTTYKLMRELEDAHWWFVARRQIIASVIARLELPADANILEVGCGTGGNLGMLRRFGTLTAIESEADAAEMARERALAPVLPGCLPDGLPDVAGQFDLIGLFDVIEHVEEDQASLVKLRGLLRKNGRILVTVPAFNFLWSQHDDENHHKRRYRRRDIISLASRSGLAVDYLSYFNFWLFPAVAGVRVARKFIPYKESWQDMRQPSPGVNRLLQSIFSSEKHLLGRFSLPYGLSLLAVLSNPADNRPG